MTTQNLSQDGRRRRDAMLPMLQRAVRARRQRRLAARAAGAALVLALVSTGAWVAWRPHGSPTPILVDGPGPAVAPDAVASAPTPASETPGETLVAESSRAPERSIIPRVRVVGGGAIRRVEGDPDAVVRVRRGATPEVATASDDALAHGLRAAGINAGVARAGSRVLIVPDEPPPAG